MPIAKKTNEAKATLLNPQARTWGAAEIVVVRLEPTPISMQPSEYITSTYAQVLVEHVEKLEVKALHNGAELFFRLEWEDAHRDIDVSDPSTFADGAAILFPFGADAPLITMGSLDQPVNQWHWRADLQKPYNVTTAGLGTTYRTPQSFIEAGAVWENGRWALVFARLLQTSDPDNHVPFKIGQTIKAAFAVWQGSQKERAGLKSYSPTWTEFTLEA
jgi:DMSO reductase family type II enzyme heme b subunit